MAKKGFRLIKNKEKVLKRMIRAIDLPSELMPNNTKIELTGNYEAVVDCCKGIVDYDDSFVKLSAGKYPITIYGVNLILKNLSDSSLIITGKITNIEIG